MEYLVRQAKAGTRGSIGGLRRGTSTISNQREGGGGLSQVAGVALQSDLSLSFPDDPKAFSKHPATTLLPFFFLLATSCLCNLYVFSAQ